jgi:epoxyqueuosine reductase
LSLKAWLLEAALEEGCSRAGIAGVSPFSAERQHLLARQRKGPGLPFSGSDILTRTEPARLLPGVKSILSLSFDYRAPSPGPKPGDMPRGSWSRFARVKDYHQVVAAAMARLVERLQKEKPGARCRACVDTGPLLDRAVARRAGLGFFGKNNCLIHPALGSFTFLGEILLDVPLEPDTPSDSPGCGSCRRCLDACPTGALSAPFHLDYTLCLSYLTQTADFLPPEARPLMGDNLYGCDLCQEACPFNRRRGPAELLPDFLPREDPYPPLLPLLDLGRQGFAARFKDSPLFWRGRSILQRNAIIALGNLEAEEAEVPLGRLLLEDPRPMIRGYSAWALGRTGGSRGLGSLARAVARETEVAVLQEIAGALSRRQQG